MLVKNIFNIKFATALILSMLLAIGVQAGGRLDKLTSALDLSDEQVTQMKELHKEKKAQKKQHKEQRQAMKKSVMALMDNYTDQQVSVLADEAAEMARTMTLTRLQRTQKMYAILNQEQQSKFKELMAKQGGKKHGWGKGRSHWGHSDED